MAKSKNPDENAENQANDDPKTDDANAEAIARESGTDTEHDSAKAQLGDGVEPETDPLELTEPVPETIHTDETDGAVQDAATDSAEDTADPGDDETEAARDDAKEMLSETEDAEYEDLVPDTAASDPEPVSSEPAAPPPPPPQRSSGSIILPLFLGGLIAGGIGYAAAYLLPAADTAEDDALTAELVASIEAQDAEIATLRDQLSALGTQVEASNASEDLSGALDALRTEMAADVAELDQLETSLDGLRSEFSSLAEELASLASQATGGTSDLTDAQLLQFQQQLATSLEDARTELEAAVEAAQSDLAEAQARASELEQEAAAAAELSAAEAALAQIGAALDAGTAFGGPLQQVAQTGADIPEALSAVASDGVETLPALTASFPDKARDALEASIVVEEGDTAMDRAMAFLKVQTGARSLTPKDGDDPDAVLSRAEAAIRQGDLTTALAELGALPEAGAQAMSGWVSAATERQAAIDALANLRTAIETN